MKKIKDTLIRWLNATIGWLNPKIDKVAHFGGGYIVATILPIPAIYGLILAVVVGALKEYRDKKSGLGTPDIWDFAATALGGLLGYVALLLK